VRASYPLSYNAPRSPISFSMTCQCLASPPLQTEIVTGLTRVSVLVKFSTGTTTLTEVMTTLDGISGTVCSAEQYQQSLPSQDNPIPLISCLTHGQAIGLTVRIQLQHGHICPFIELLPRTRVQLIVEASLLSLLSVIAIYIWIGVSLTPFTHRSCLTRLCAVEYTMVQEKCQKKLEIVPGGC
jgi:hypothetical protein